MYARALYSDKPSNNRTMARGDYHRDHIVHLVVPGHAEGDGGVTGSALHQEPLALSLPKTDR